MLQLKKHLQGKQREETTLEKTKGKIVICESCGAEYDASLVRCPYCGTAYEPAAEEEYMGKLEDVRSDLSTHTKDAERDIWKMFKKILAASLIVILIAALLSIAALIIPKSGSRHNTDDINSRKEDIIRGE